MDPKFEERAIREFDYKSIGYFEGIKDMGNESLYRGHLVMINHFKEINHGIPYKSPDNSYSSDITDIKKLK